VALGAGRLHVEADPVVAQDHLDLVPLLRDRDPDIRRSSVLERVHHGLASVVVEEQRDRRRELDLLDVGVEPNVGLAPDLDEESMDRFLETGAPERRSVQFSGQGANAIGGSVLRVLDLEQHALGLVDLARFQVPPCNIDLDREAEQKLREVVVEEGGDLQSFVLSLFGHPSRKRPQDMFAILEFFVRLLERLASEEHLTGKEERENDCRDGDKPDSLGGEDVGEDHTEDRESEVADEVLAQATDLELPDDAEWIHPKMDTCRNANEARIDSVISHRCKACSQ